MIKPATIEKAIESVTDETSFIQVLLIDTLGWAIDPDIKTVDEMTYEWTQDELRAAGLDKKIVDGTVRQLAMPGCPWGVFLLEFENPDVFTQGRGMTGPLRQALKGLVASKRKSPNLPSFHREELLFICTHKYTHFRFAHFKAPTNSIRIPPVASFGWYPGDSTKTVCEYNLPHLAFLDDDATAEAWISEWSSAFDVDRVTKRFYTDYQALHDSFRDSLKGIKGDNARKWLASVVLNRLMFVYFLQKKGFLSEGCLSYLEDKLVASKSKGRNKFYREFLTLLFFEGFAKPEAKRSKAAREILGDIAYLNGGLFLPHPLEQAAEEAGKHIDLPDAVFDKAFKFFASFSWNLNDIPGGQDNEINPDVLGYILEKYINQKAFGAYYTRPHITNYLCDRTIHRLVLDAVNTPKEVRFGSVAEMIQKLDNNLASKLLNDILPEIKLLDPACGSGAFLVAAMKTLIDLYAAIFGWVEFHGSPKAKAELKDIRARHPSLDYYIKKRIISDNLFGVDLMPEAVEIARLRLFLSLVASANAVEEMEPLPNIDFNLLPGNSLVGLLNIDPGEFDQMKNLYLPSYGDVLVERDQKLDTYRHAAQYTDDLTAMRDAIAEVNDHAQQTLDDMLREDFKELGIKYEQATWDLTKQKPGKPIKRQLTVEDIERLTPFHWAFAFSSVMQRGGFDAIITNPPWEVFKPNGKEFFEDYSDIVTKKSMSIQDFHDEQGELLKDREIRQAWLDYLSQYPHQSLWFRKHPDFAHQTAKANGKKVGSDLNLYKLFTERCYRLLRENGQCGIVIPSGIYTDLGAKGLRELLFDHTKIDALFGMENRKGVFEDVHKSFKFVVLTFGRGGSTEIFPAAFMRHEVSELDDFPRQGAMPIEVPLVRKLSPDSLSVMEFKSETDVVIARKMLRYPLLGDDVPDRWKLKLTAEFHMTNDSGLFHTRPAKGRLPLYEGKMIWHFNHQFAEPRYWVNEKEGRARLTGRTEDTGQLLDYQCYRLGFRDVASSTNERSAIAQIIPKRYFTGNTLPTQMTCVPECATIHETLALTSFFNSFVFDWLIRQKITNHLNMFYVYQMPVPRLADGDPGFAPIVERAAKLICTTPEFDDLAAEIVPGADHATLGVTNPKERAALRAELDGMVAHLYGLTADEFEHVLDTFRKVEKQIKDDAFTAYQSLIKSGQAAKLNPKLADAGSSGLPPADQAVLDIIEAGESATVEFKSSARWDIRKDEAAKYIEKIIVKTVAAMLNTDGGTLLIGVDDDGNILGLANDFSTLRTKKDRDGYELWLMNHLLKDFGKDAAAQIEISFHALADAAGEGDDGAASGALDVCRVSLQPSPRPRYVLEEGNEAFYIRTGNATNKLKASEIAPYQNARWPAGVEFTPEPEFKPTTLQESDRPKG